MTSPITETVPLITPASICALLIFLTTYAIIISERVHRTIIALFGATVMILLGVGTSMYSQHLAIQAIDFNTIGLLIGMMIIVTVTKHSGLFQYVAIKAAKLAGGDPKKILIFFAIITAVFSALLDNVTTVMLMVPMTLVICANLKVNPIPYLITEILLSNIGGAATLIGDPPNILIGSAAGLTFIEFLNNLGPITLITAAVVLPFLMWIYKQHLVTTPELQKRICKLREHESIKDPVLLKKSIGVLLLVLLGFFLHGPLGLEGATIAIFGAALLLLLDSSHLENVLKEIEWTTIFFFVGLFVLVGGIEQAGIIHWAAEHFLQLTGGSQTATVLAILWSSALFSAFVDNIPFVATMIPLIHTLGASFANLKPLWWALAIGADFGGNGTLIGASANLVVADMARKSNYHLGFKDFMKIGMMVMTLSILISTVYITLRYLT